METRWQQVLAALPLCSVLVVQVCGVLPLKPRISTAVTLDSTTLSLVRHTSQLFLSFNLDSSYLQNGWVDKHIRDEKVLKLASHLAPAYMRIGGTDSDKMLFKVTSSSPLDDRQQAKLASRESYVYMNDKEWTLINQFAEKAGLKLIFSLNIRYRAGNFWNSSNTKQLLDFNSKHGYKVDFGLGNEPDMFSCVYQSFITRQKLAEGVAELRTLLDSHPQFKDSLIIGPDTTDVPSSKWYLSGFLQFQNNTIDGVSVHHYYKKGAKAKLQDFYDPTIFNTLPQYIDEKHEIIANASLTAPLWFSETGTTSDGGTTNITDKFVDGFLWLDKLGIAAKMGVQIVCRQCIYGHSNGLLNFSTLDPNPDWWLSVLYKKLVGVGVLNTTIPTGSVRLYAHCSKTSPGSVVLFGMNLNSQQSDVKVTINMAGVKPEKASAYILTGETGLRSQTVLLNGRRLVVGANYSLPSLEPVTVAVSPLHLPAYSLAFFVLHDLHVSACKEKY